MAGFVVYWHKDFTFGGLLDDADQALAKDFLDRLTDIDFEILDENMAEDSQKSTVTVKITAHNVGEKILEGVKTAVPLAVKLAFAKEDEKTITKEVFNALLTPVQSSTKSITKTININLTNKNGEWKIGTNNFDFINSITGGFNDITGQLDFLQ